MTHDTPDSTEARSRPTDRYHPHPDAAREGGRPKLTPVQRRYLRWKEYGDTGWTDKSDWQKNSARRSHLRSLPLTPGNGADLLAWLDSDGTDGLTERVPTATGETLVDPRYTESTRSTYDSQRECARAFERWHYKPGRLTRPRRYGNPGRDVPYFEGYSSSNYEYRQYVDGTGEIWHYGTRACIRTVEGKIFNNRQDYGAGFAHVTHPSSDYPPVPLDGIERVLDETDVDADIFDITDVHTARDARLSTGRTRGARHPLLVELRDDNGGVVVIRDSTTKDRDARLCGFYVTADEIRQARTVFDLEDLLVPEEVRRSGYPVVPVDQMVPYRSSHYAPTHGKDDRGEVAQRQGEWFFVPVDEFDVAVADGGLPRTCAHCGASAFEVIDAVTTCKACGHQHVDPDSHDGWRDTLDSHQPTKYVPPMPDDSDRVAGYVRGTARHDRNEHYMGRFGDTWHKAVTHGRDVLVFDLSTRGTGGGGGWD